MTNETRTPRKGTVTVEIVGRLPIGSTFERPYIHVTASEEYFGDSAQTGDELVKSCLEVLAKNGALPDAPTVKKEVKEDAPVKENKMAAPAPPAPTIPVKTDKTPTTPPAPPQQASSTPAAPTLEGLVARVPVDKLSSEELSAHTLFKALLAGKGTRPDSPRAIGKIRLDERISPDQYRALRRYTENRLPGWRKMWAEWDEKKSRGRQVASNPVTEQEAKRLFETFLPSHPRDLGRLRASEENTPCHLTQDEYFAIKRYTIERVSGWKEAWEAYDAERAAEKAAYTAQFAKEKTEANA